jgi:hypothetical protein
MAIFGSVFALLGRFAGRLLNSALGWATILLFGKVDGSKQTVLLVMALGSLVWVVTLVGILVPDVGTFVLAFVPVPSFVDPSWVRVGMLALALLIPLVIGIAAVALTEASRRPGGAGLVSAVLRGYPFTLVLAVTIGFLAVVSLLRKLRSLARRWEDSHVPIIVQPGGYDAVIGDLSTILDAASLQVRPTPAPRIMSLPARLLDGVAGKALGALVPDRLVLLTGPGLEILVYPSDLAIAGSKDRVARARAAVAAGLTRAPAYLTTSAEAERIEDDIRRLAQASGPGADGLLAAIDQKIAHLAGPFDEWETVYRQRLQVERDLLLGRAGRSPGPGRDAAPARPRPGAVDVAIAISGLVLVALDVGLQLRQRVRPRPSRAARRRR